MALYDDLDTKQVQRTDKIDGWSSGIKLLATQNQMIALKKKMTVPRKNTVLGPVINLKSKRDVDDIFKTTTETIKPNVFAMGSSSVGDYDWDFIDEYDPLWPNDYEKIKDKKDKERDNKVRDREDKKREERDRKRRGSRFNNESPPTKVSGFGGRVGSDEDDYTPITINSQQRPGAAIAPPASLQEDFISESSKSSATISHPSSSVAAKIMAKYGFRDGQGLGKQEQGMSMALQVEKTSKRGGRIIHEKELMAPPTILPIPDKDEKPQPSITEIMKSPSKVVLLRNMVGPGDVDSDLEPEVKDECNTKYGDVISVKIVEVQQVVPEDAVRIFVEFKRIESAIKAVVDLNGRFFGGRQVRAGFFSYENYHKSQLLS